MACSTIDADKTGSAAIIAGQMRFVRSTWIIGAPGSVAPMLAASDYKAGVARLDITPTNPIRMAGYGGRDQLSQSVAMRLYAKALAIEDRKGGRLVLVTTDLLGLPRSVSDVVGARVEKEYGLERSRLILNSSHTHAGPIVGSEGRLASELRDEQKRVVMEYRNALVEQLVTVAGAALRDLTEVEITFGTGEATFAVNRRLKGPQGVQIGVNPQGPTDPQVTRNTRVQTRWICACGGFRIRVPQYNPCLGQSRDQRRLRGKGPRWRSRSNFKTARRCSLCSAAAIKTQSARPTRSSSSSTAGH